VSTRKYIPVSACHIIDSDRSFSSGSFSAEFLRASEVSHGRSPLLALNQVGVLVTDLGELA
jgi:hypothetical protein